MSKYSPLIKSLFLVPSIFVSALMSVAFAHQHQNDEHAKSAESNQSQTGIMVMDGYARATFAMAKTGAVYFTLHNQNNEPVTLTAVSVDSAVASDAQIHTTEMQDDVMKMREMTEGVNVDGNDMVSFKPGGYHIMLLGLSKGLEEGSNVALTLTFDKQRELHVTLPVKKDENAGHHHHH